MLHRGRISIRYLGLRFSSTAVTVESSFNKASQHFNEHGKLYSAVAGLVTVVFVTSTKVQSLQKDSEMRDLALQKDSEMRDQALQKDSEMRDQALQKDSEMRFQALQKDSEMRDQALQKDSEMRFQALQKDSEMRDLVLEKDMVIASKEVELRALENVFKFGQSEEYSAMRKVRSPSANAQQDKDE
jgi:hypothetical protein